MLHTHVEAESMFEERPAPPANLRCWEGLRERAKRAGGTQAIFSELGAGTEAKLTIPARASYEKRRGKGRFRSGRLLGKAQERALREYFKFPCSAN
jgi:hypothetical protein